jgi:ankyrin repeat protein
MRLLPCLSLAVILIATAAVSAPLHEAARARDGAAIVQLLKAGADINERDENGETPIFAAATTGDATIIDQLMIAGADAAIRNNEGLTAAHAAAASGDSEAVSVLVGDAKLSKRIELDDHDNELGITALMVAVDADEGDVVAHLIGLGADKEIADREGRTALTHALERGHDQIVTILLRSGALCQDIDAALKAKCDARKAELGR